MNWNDTKWEGDSSEDEYWEEEDDSDEAAETINCPNCKREIYEEAQRCPYCEHYVSHENVLRSSQPTWVVATAFVLIALFLYFAIAPFFGEFF